MTQEEIVTNTKTVLQGLEALRLEHMSIIAGLNEDKKDPDKSDIIQKNIENIELGLGEAQVNCKTTNPFMAPH
jgi:kinesin light chain